MEDTKPVEDIIRNWLINTAFQIETVHMNRSYFDVVWLDELIAHIRQLPKKHRLFRWNVLFVDEVLDDRRPAYPQCQHQSWRMLVLNGMKSQADPEDIITKHTQYLVKKCEFLF